MQAHLSLLRPLAINVRSLILPTPPPAPQAIRLQPKQRRRLHSLPAAASSVAAERRVDPSQVKKATPAVTTLPSPGPSGLDPGEESFTEEHRIRSYEVGPDQRTSIVTIANLLQEVAGNHGVAMWGRGSEGFATDPIMVENHLIFVTTRIQMRMKSYPKWGDLVSIKTWFQRDGRIAFTRNWVIRNASTGEQLGAATSTWIMLNTQTRRPARIPDSMLDKLATFSPDQPKQCLPEDECKQKLPDFPMPPEITGPTQVARRSDVDMNQHLNNVTYLAWCLETVPLDIYTDCQLHQVEIDYKAECVAGDKVDCLGAVLSDADTTSNGDGTRQLLHMLQRCDAGGCQELVRCRTAWRPAPHKIAAAEALGAAGAATH
mmetsp:Transcript_20653/g.62236  ORF Transcript_20653/g.62236 Transcript_20653/m.62236 type:complete len:374 (-) Transcript_20653:315-1436(-)|eukprot:CAMPEP_0206139138 /NCGR_PEP_ID=MMETSP1473-20131121/4863_1 /ASSEMBLY_ACC=CAM_ASM_001109 /TAXON_ID=1461547 /ORGANISM="Stichococcus sp, Strain RCC1054" /LENGTH=373 /DNA_ID=CAMNT_0053532791 /DNA_START=105 /DNA_END=1226 /DNA_ORIENTATION=-